MAKTKGTALSVEAAGKLAGALCYSTWRGRPYIKLKRDAKQPRAPLQLGSRAVMAFLTAQWASFSASIKASWQPEAEARNIPPYNFYLSYNLAQFQQGHGISYWYPPPRSATPDQISNWSATPSIRHAKIWFTRPGTGNSWCEILCRSTTSGFTPGHATCVSLLPYTWSMTWIDGPIPAGTYYYRIGVVPDDGTPPAYHADEKSAVVTN